MTIDDVYRLFGEASHWASILEEQLGNICMLNERVMNQDKYEHESAKSIVEKFQKFTIGALITEIKKALGKELESKVDTKELESKVDTIFRPALEKRNRLIHGFFIDHHDILKSYDGIPKAIAELNEIKSIIFPAADFATKMCVELTELYSGARNGAAQPIIPLDAAR
ncbi:MAG: hypothetical protein PHI11_12465 [Gallionella sp.]|nr:hypothetical protein [Gallionella sp.]